MSVFNRERLLFLIVEKLQTCHDCFLSLRLEGVETLKYRCLSVPVRKSLI